MSLETDVAEIKTKVTYIEKEVTTNLYRFNEHIKTSEIYRERVNSLEGIKKELENHTIVDRWMFGVLITMSLAILVKLFT